MADKPTNLFTSNSFISLVIAVLSASAIGIGDMQRNGVTIEKSIYLAISILGAAGVTSDKMKKEPEVFTPNWCPLGRGKADVVIPQVITVPLPEILAPVEQTLDAVQDIIDDAQTAVSVAQNPLNLLKLL